MKYSYILILLLVVYPCAYAEDNSKFSKVTKDYSFSFPKDHGAHYDYPVEWWYFTGHLEDKNANQYGIQLTFFRVGVKPGKGISNNWELNDVYLAHAGVSDVKNKKFYHFEKTSRGSFKTAGAKTDNLGVWLGNWSSKMEEGLIKLSFKDQGVEFRATLASKKEISLQGDNGFSKKGEEEGNASLYMSFTDLVGDGVFKLNDEEIKFKSEFWMDHEVLSSFKSFDNKNNSRGWDWFAIKLSSGEDLMLYQIKNSDGIPTGYSSGNLIQKDGTNIHLKKDDFEIIPTETWQSPKTKRTYPSKWQIKIPSKQITLTVIPEFSNQELTTKNTGKTYWEGKCQVICSNDQTCGKAYVELVGY